MISAQFLHKELPVRLAHRVVELENLPYGLSYMGQIRQVRDLLLCHCALMRPCSPHQQSLNSSSLQVRDWYVDSFMELRKFPEIKVNPSWPTGGPWDETARQGAGLGWAGMG